MTSKYPCGACSIGVKYSAIKCTGPCHLWYHAGCVNITDKCLKKLSKVEINTWTCRNCSDLPKLPTISVLQDKANQSLDLAPITSSGPQNKTSNNSITALENSLIENDLLQNSVSEEDKLTIAATIGSALREENRQLKEQISILESKLTSTQCKLASSEAKIEELTEEEDKYNRRIESLTQELAEL
ncbi:hypothetical protein J6590_007506 [Homalodisca vitripennis]|nr:hypothetical protein J6590_007506 [Homalodisca vitripennis]